MTMPIIGRTELVKFPQLIPEDSEGLLAKIDTGADSGAIHCVYVAYGLDDDGKKYVEYKAIDDKHPLHKTYDYQRVNVTSSNGAVEKRFRVATEVEIRGQSYPIEITLTDRSDMSYEVIIGWRFLQKRFLVDPDLSAD